MIKYLAVFFFFVGSMFAATTHVMDNAFVLGNRAGELNEALQGGSVWVETFANAPDGNVQHYAEKRIKELTKEGFIIVVTTSPRKWQIRMVPEGKFSPEATEEIGRKMGAAFRTGHYYEGFIDAFQELRSLLIAPKVVAISVETKDVGVKQQEPTTEKETPYYWLYFTFVFLATILIAALLYNVCYVPYRQNKIAEQFRLKRGLGRAVEKGREDKPTKL